MATHPALAESSVPVARAARSRHPSKHDWRGSFPVSRGDLEPTGTNPYFVLLPGYRLHYAHGKDTLTVSVLEETRMVDGVQTRVVEEREVQGGRLHEVSRNYFAIDRVTKDVYYFGEDTEEYADGRVSREGSWLAGTNGARFGLAIPGDVRVGDRFYEELAPGVAMDRAEVTAVGAERKTPAGTFKNCVGLLETTPLEPDRSTKWFAPGVGLIQDDEFVLLRVEQPAR